jgi:hypothetical protein
MSQALETVDTCKILIDHPLLTAKLDKYSYRLERNGSQTSYTVSDGAQSLTLPVRWALGTSSGFGQTYVLEKDGELYESRVSYFRELNGLGPTLGSANVRPANLLDAAGRFISHDEKLLCFGCHATNARQGKQLTLEKMTPGVQCGRCHDSVDTHLATELVQENSDAPIPKELSKLNRLSTEDISNFCGQCHRTWAEIAAQPHPNISNIRFQPYRLTGSKCYDTDDPRISCIACHNPHHEVSDTLTDYDAKCQACHAPKKSNAKSAANSTAKPTLTAVAFLDANNGADPAGKHAITATASTPQIGKPGAKSCPVAHTQCVTCHMPKIELPGSHHKFSDHRIRIVRPNQPYPG